MTETPQSARLLRTALPIFRPRRKLLALARQPSAVARFVKLAGSQGERAHRRVNLRGRKAISVQLEKENGRRKTDPFVSIDKGVIADQSESIGCRHVGKAWRTVGEQVDGAGKRRFQHPLIPNASGS